MRDLTAEHSFPDKTHVEVFAHDALRSVKVHRGYDYWNNLRGSRLFPERQEIRPRDIASILTNMVLIRSVNGPDDLEFRIVGDHAGRGYMNTLAGKRMSEMAAAMPRAVRSWRSLYQHVWTTKAPVAAHVTVGLDAQEVNFSQAESVFLPLGGADGVVDHLILFVEHRLRA